jgi:bifunctional NMN adenylyltransferase/nudix hydrolase
MQKPTLGIFIGRFQPLHAGHREVIRQVSKEVQKTSGLGLVLIGSANVARSVKNPWTLQERRIELRNFLFHEGITNVNLSCLNDYKYSDSQWLNDVTSIVNEYNANDTYTVKLFGFAKEGNDYLDWFPQYEFINVTTPYDVCSTDIREQWFQKESHRFVNSVIADWDYFKKEKALFRDYPFKETLNFNCADAILECCGHILLIKRGAAPGKGNWALPGGFKNANETFQDCAIRELMEETNVRVPEKVLRGSIVSSKLFDSPTRGQGIPRNTLAIHIKVLAGADGSLPRAKGMDDAVEAKWFPISVIMNNISMHDDHAAIISTMCGVLPLPAHVNPRFFN